MFVSCWESVESCYEHEWRVFMNGNVNSASPHSLARSWLARGTFGFTVVDPDSSIL